MNYDFSQNQIASNPFFQSLAVGQELARQALGFVDIGARGGTHNLVRAIAQVTDVIAFEPDPEEFQALLRYQKSQTDWHSFNVSDKAIYNSKGKHLLNILSSDTNSSLISTNSEIIQRYNMPKWQLVGKTEIETDTLDSALAELKGETAGLGEVLKIDTQGTEYEILTEARSTLEHTGCIITEVSFCEIYKQQKLFSDIESLLRGLGFRFYGFYPMQIHTRSKQYLDKQHQWGRERPFYADAVFFRDPLDQKTCDKPSLRSIAILYTSTLLLGFFDFAHEIAESFFSDKDRASSKALISELAFKSSDLAAREVRALLKEIDKSPEKANLLIGKLIDKHKSYTDYSDVFI